MLYPMKLKHSRLNKSQTKKLLEFFIAGTTARMAAELVGVNRNTSINFYDKVRQIIAFNLELESPFIDGEIEVDGSCFVGSRKGKRGRGAAGKAAVFGLLNRGGRVYTQIILDANTETLMPIIREKAKPGSIIYTDTFRSYSALDVSEFKHYRINHSELFADKLNHINGI